MKQQHDRRAFLRMMGFGAAGAGAVAAGVKLVPAGASGQSDAPQLDSSSPTTPADGSTTDPVVRTQRPRSIPDGQRTLVVVELDGGNDGLSTLIPATDNRYRRLRATTGHAPEEVIDIGDGLGLNPNLAGLHRRGLAVVAGVGSQAPDLSHFEMARRWAFGDSAGTEPPRDGFLGRCCNSLRGDELVTGISLGWGSVPAMIASESTTMSLPDPDGFEVMVRRDLWASEFRDGLSLMSAAGSPPESRIATARSGLSDALEFGNLVGAMPEVTDIYPEDEFAYRLAVAGRVIRSGAGVRVLHIPLGGFDTHDEHRWQHDDLMRRLDEGVSAFLDDMDLAGLGDDVVVATVSEFGRRPQENGNGTDHGAASVALLAGAVHPGIHGELSPLGDLDDDDNLRSTVDMARYYATLSEAWLGLDAAELLAGDTRPLEGVVRAA